MGTRTKCLIGLGLLLFFMLCIFLKILCDDEKPKNIDTIECQCQVNYEKSGSEFKMNKQIEFLSLQFNSSESLLNRKENAVWAAFALYISGIVFFYGYLKKLRYLKCCGKIVLCFLLLTIAISMFAFIHTQYSSIHDVNSTTRASKDLLLQIIENEKPIENFASTHYCMYKYNLKKYNKFRGNLYPLRIVYSFICLDWTKSGKRELSSVTTQEAALYFLLIIFNLIGLYFLWRDIYRLMKT